MKGDEYLSSSVINNEAVAKFEILTEYGEPNFAADGSAHTVVGYNPVKTLIISRYSFD